MNSFTSAYVRDSWRRWLAWLLLAAVFAIACAFLSQWQFNRRGEALAMIAIVEANYDRAPIPIDALAAKDSFNPMDEWKPAALTGHFLIDDAVLVRNRPLNGQPGFLQLIPFATNSGRTFAVVTGWIPTGDKQDFPDTVPMPRSAATEIVARIRPTEPSLNRDAPAQQIATINIDSLIEKTQVSASTVRSFYLVAAEKYASGNLPVLGARPQLTEGNHLSYALQWILFAVMAFGALWWAIKQEIKMRRLAIDPSFKPKQRAKVGDRDNAAEDAATS
jgi:cytochrome oxidase assembly protein ShyY1